MPYGFILIPSDAESARLVAYARHVRGAAPALMTLGPKAPPHVSVIHLACDLAAARFLWTRLDAIAGRSIDVTMIGIMFAPIAVGDYYVPEGGVYVGLEARQTSELIAAHQTALVLARDAGVGVLGAAGQNYRPHLTLGVLEGFPEYRIIPPPDLVNTSLECRWALGRLDAYGTFPEILSIGSSSWAK